MPFECTVAARPESDKLLGLELLRFASAMAVLFFHYRHFARMAGMEAVSRAEAPFYSLFWLFYDYGQFGVQVFWAISGYIFFWKYAASINAGAVAARDFFWLRFSRLYPLHIVTLVGVVGLQYVYRHFAASNFIYPTDDPGMFVHQIFLATDWGESPPFNFNGPIWSISAEVAVYAFFFLLLRRFAPSRELCIGVVVAGVALLLAGIEWASIGCATFFFAGGLASLAPPKARRFAGPVLVAVIVIFAATGALAERAKIPTFLLVAAPCMLVLLAQMPLPRRWHRPIQAAGNLTYSSYLLHFPLQLMLAIGVAASGLTPPLTNPLFLAAYLGVTLTVAAISYRWFELPAQNWLRRRMLQSRLAA
ncbi:acyltransferase [Sphingomonas sp. G124]|uniref:Acyltransferase n=1 Tax=Sphingomonas cremea TaxID=2904799 RepID=A0A9X1TXS2_9SPHN|nr:acyltransferase [Sphingomonas cremea]MCF2514117.1 acyltransferase [Sphingomonas cremea]